MGGSISSCNNAGIEGALAPLVEYSEAQWDDVININLKGTWLCMKAEIQQMRTQGGGLPDYSELFVFSWSGKYSVQVVITPAPGAKPIRTRFGVDHRL